MCPIIKFDNRLKICITNSHLGVCKRPSRSITGLDFATTGTTEQTRWPRSHAKKILHVGSGAEGAHSCAWERLICVCVCVCATHHMVGEAWRWCWMKNGWPSSLLFRVLCAAVWLPTLEGSPSLHRQVKNMSWTIKNGKDWLGRNTSVTSYFRWRKRERGESLIKLAYGGDELDLVR